MLACQECGQECIENRIYSLNGRTRVCAFCYRWGIKMMAAYKIKRRISPQIRARTLLNA